MKKAKTRDCGVDCNGGCDSGGEQEKFDLAKKPFEKYTKKLMLAPFIAWKMMFAKQTLATFEKYTPQKDSVENAQKLHERVIDDPEAKASEYQVHCAELPAIVCQINEFVEAFPTWKKGQDVVEMQWKVVALVSAFFALRERFERDVVALREIHEENRDAQNMERGKARFAWSRRASLKLARLLLWLHLVAVQYAWTCVLL